MYFISFLEISDIYFLITITIKLKNVYMRVLFLYGLNFLIILLSTELLSIDSGYFKYFFKISRSDGKASSALNIKRIMTFQAD